MSDVGPLVCCVSWCELVELWACVGLACYVCWRGWVCKRRGMTPHSAVSSLSDLVCCGGVLLSHNLSVAVPSALPGLASRFGMLLGVSPVL